MKWATRSNMKTDRCACAWLIKRFIDPEAQFFFFEKDVLLAEAKRIDAKTFDAEGADYRHVGISCTFEHMLSEYDLWNTDAALDHMAEIIHASDVSVKMYDFSVIEGFTVWALAQGWAVTMPDDNEKLEKILPIYEALYEWCKQKTGKMKMSAYTAQPRDWRLRKGRQSAERSGE